MMDRQIAGQEKTQKPQVGLKSESTEALPQIECIGENAGKDTVVLLDSFYHVLARQASMNWHCSRNSLYDN
jgi:hypothetical protein